ncbi:MAG TPA: AMP-binding protein [Methylotenera sp.]|nr:AMP-binding protein [Methylotenera sp.]
MNTLIHALKNHAQLSPTQVALHGADFHLNYRDLYREITALTQLLQEQVCEQFEAPVIAISIENHPAWVVVDIASANAEIPVVPIPFFFTATQQLHAIEDAGVNCLITDRPAFYKALLKHQSVLSQREFDIAGKTLTQFEFTTAVSNALPANTAKITYTSGTTGNPKGVCLNMSSILLVAESLREAVKMHQDDVHLCILPLSTLLENIAGIYTTLLAGAKAVLLPGDSVGLNLEKASADGLDAQKMLSALETSKASTSILTPELLLALTKTLETTSLQQGSTTKLPAHLRFLAVGGASTSPSLLERARAVGLPVYEGYGLSEGCSVVALNTEQDNKIGSVGKLLPHASIKFSKDGEILVKGATLLGYANNQLQSNSVTKVDYQTSYYPTGDIGRLDSQGYLYIIGRKKNIFITSFGRNVSPEWVERELTLSPYIAQAILFGEAKPWNTLLITLNKAADSRDVQAAIDNVNQNLPYYARVEKWLYTNEPFSKANGELTNNGRLRRDAIWQHYQTQVNALYIASDISSNEEPHNAVL